MKRTPQSPNELSHRTVSAAPHVQMDLTAAVVTVTHACPATSARAAAERGQLPASSSRWIHEPSSPETQNRRPRIRGRTQRELQSL